MCFVLFLCLFQVKLAEDISSTGVGLPVIYSDCFFSPLFLPYCYLPYHITESNEKSILRNSFSMSHVTKVNKKDYQKIMTFSKHISSLIKTCSSQAMPMAQILNI